MRQILNLNHQSSRKRNLKNYGQVLSWAHAQHIGQVGAWSEEIRYEALMLWRKLGFSFARIDFTRGEEKRYGFYVTKRLG